MNIEQIAKEARLSMLRDFYGLSKEINICVNDDTEFLRRCLKKLAEQDVEPFGYYENGRFSVNSNGGPDKWRERKEYAGAIYTETQLLTAQQKAAEACAKAVFEQAKYFRYNAHAEAVRYAALNKWSEYL